MRLVVKVGTSTLAHPTGRINIRHVETLCKVLSDLKNSGIEVILVSSGAIGMGIGKLNLKGRPEDMATKQAAAAVGQCELMYTYDKLFSGYNHTVAQILLTGYDVRNKESYGNFCNTMFRLIDLGVLPVINDNDTLSAIVATSIKADLLVLLSDIDGLYTTDPHKCSDAQLIDTVSEITDDIVSLAGGACTSQGTGGMATKINAAQMCMKNGCNMIIANGKNPEILYDITEGKKIGTRFIATGVND